MNENGSIVRKFEKALNSSKAIEEKRSVMLKNAGLKSGLKETEIFTVFSVLQQMIHHVEMDSQSKKVDCNAKACRTRQSSEMSWTERAQVCSFYYHPALGNKDLGLTSVVYSLNPRTIEG